MSTNKSASLEARIKNNIDLIQKIREYSLYNPTNENIRAENYAAYADQVDSHMTQYREAYGALINSIKDNASIFTRLEKLSRDVRFEIGEVKGKQSAEYAQVNSIVKLITGENINEHSKMKKKVMGGLKEGDPKPEFSSVSALDFKSKLGNFKSLIGLIRNYDFYAPAESNITVTSLEAFEREVSGSLVNVASRETNYTNKRSAVIHYFNDENGLKDRAGKAKMHVKRKYGVNSPEYKALVNRNY